MVSAVDLKIEVLTEFLNDLDDECSTEQFVCFVFDQNGYIIGKVKNYASLLNLSFMP